MVSTTEVAKHAGVSQTTVSRVLNRPEQVKKETYDKVMQALAELDYGNASPLNTEEPETSREVLVLFSKNCSAEAFEALRELTEHAQTSGYFVAGRSLTGSETTEDAKQFLKQAAGVIGIGELPAGLKEQIAEMGIVFLQTEDMVDSVQPFDGRKAAYLAASHLAQENHEQIAWVGTDQAISGERLQGYYEALAHHQLKLRKKRIHTPQSLSDFETIAAELRSFKKPTTAFVTATYEDGVQLLNALRSVGFKVPKDISLIAVGEPKEGETTALTAVKPVPGAKSKSQEMIQQLVQQIEGKEAETKPSEEELQIDNKKTVKAYKDKQKNKA